MEIVPREASRPERLSSEGPEIRIGEWYWLRMFDGDKAERMACVTEIGSNYVELKDVYGHNNRVHLNDFDRTCRKEPDPQSVIRAEVDGWRTLVQKKLGEIRDLMASLGISKNEKLERAGESENSRALAVLSGTDNIGKYKSNLIKAENKDLPKLFEEVRKANKEMARWMGAETLALEGMIGVMDGCVEDVKDRIFNVTLYAGLSEQVTVVQEGEPAAAGEKLRIMQRLLYMDEESLLDYKHGGMDWKSLKDFDKWLAKPKNINRVLPYPRSMTAFRVRRTDKVRDWYGSVEKLLANIADRKADKWTFLYIRNGERLYRMDCELEFDELIFPGRYESDLSEPMMAKVICGSVTSLITKRDWEAQKKAVREGIKNLEKWRKENHGKDDHESPHHEYGWSRDDFDDYKPFDKSSVYYDEMLETIQNRVKYYNRIALIVQGLYDRSEILHPHPPVYLWSPEGFAAAVELIYDGTNVLSHGEPPDFEKYMAEKNRSLAPGCVTVGQDEYWQEKEAEKESSRMGRSRYTRSEWRPSRHKPYGNPGPGYLAKVVEWTPRTRKAKFEWTRERLTRDYWGRKVGDGLLKAAIWVPESRLFNVSAYKPGEFLQFYQDPRTRSMYMKWASLLLAAEDYHAGKLKLNGE
jgi:hypothetical protein